MGRMDIEYSALATQIAKILWGMCDYEIDGRLQFTHNYENYLELPCDMLQRLGAMIDNEVAHQFAFSWEPHDPLPLTRHDGEPTTTDLAMGLTFYTQWFPRDSAASNRDVEATTDLVIEDRQKLTPARRQYMTWAVQGACVLLEQAGAGSWNSDGMFVPLGEFVSDDNLSLERYVLSKRRMVEKLGSLGRLYPSGMPARQGKRDPRVERNVR